VFNSLWGYKLLPVIGFFLFAGSFCFLASCFFSLQQNLAQTIILFSGKEGRALARRRDRG
jgi:hypothetical protein